jgi:copper chaperone CopZ
MKNKTYQIEGMDCPSCAMLIESDLEDAGIKAKVSYAKCELCLISESADEKKIQEVVETAGYKLKK